MLRALALLLLAALPALAAPRFPAGTPYAASPEIGRELLGTRPPEWTASDWIGGAPQTLASLRGKVVVIRWWTAPSCPYCAASAEGLNLLARKYGKRGLAVIGLYHHKESTPLTREHVVAQRKRLGLEFPVAIDHDWKTLHRWWLDRADRGWTSVTFVLDRQGVIRHLHPGGAYYPGEPGFEALEKAVQSAL